MLRCEPSVKSGACAKASIVDMHSVHAGLVDQGRDLFVRLGKGTPRELRCMPICIDHGMPE